MNYLINQLITVDPAFYRHYLEMFLTLERHQGLTPWQMSMLLWRAKLFHITILYPELLRIRLCTEQEKDEIRFFFSYYHSRVTKQYLLTIIYSLRCLFIGRAVKFSISIVILSKAKNLLLPARLRFIYRFFLRQNDNSIRLNDNSIRLTEAENRKLNSPAVQPKFPSLIE